MKKLAQTVAKKSATASITSAEVVAGTTLSAVQLTLSVGIITCGALAVAANYATCKLADGNQVLDNVQYAMAEKAVAAREKCHGWFEAPAPEGEEAEANDVPETDPETFGAGIMATVAATTAAAAGGVDKTLNAAADAAQAALDKLHQNQKPEAPDGATV